MKNYIQSSNDKIWVIIIVDKTDFQEKIITRDKEGHCI